MKAAVLGAGSWGTTFAQVLCDAGTRTVLYSRKPALAKTCTEITKMLLDKVQVAVVPGEAFGAPGYLRLSYATSIERIEEGLRRLERFFARAEAAS